MSSSIGTRFPRATWLLTNVPPIITIVASAVVAVLATVVDFETKHFLQLILLLIALMGTSLVTERWVAGRQEKDQLAEIVDQLTIALSLASGSKGSLDELIISRRDLGPLEERLAGANRVSISGGSLLRLTNEYRSYFEMVAANGCKLRFLMTDPQSAAAEYLSTEISYEARNLDAYRGHMRDSADGLVELCEKYPDCEIRLFDAAPPFSLVIVERSDDITIQVELYTLGVPARDRPMLLLRSKVEPRLCAVFAQQFEAMWDSRLTRPFVPHEN